MFFESLKIFFSRDPEVILAVLVALAGWFFVNRSDYEVHKKWGRR